MLKQRRSAASFFLGNSHFGFEGSSETLFLSGPLFNGVKLLGPAAKVVPRGKWVNFEVTRKEGAIRFLVNDKEIASVKHSGAFEQFGFRPWRSTMQVKHLAVKGNLVKIEPAMPRGYTIPTLDLAQQKHRQVIVDREKGQYLGHPTTVLLEDGKTILIVYPKGHGKGGIVYKRSVDGGKTGHTEAAGYCLSASAKRDGMRTIAVVTGTNSNNARKSQTAALINYGFRFYESGHLFDAGKEIAEVRVWKGDDTMLPVVAKGAVDVAFPRGQRDALTTSAELPSTLLAPIKKGERLGTLEIKYDTKTLAQVPLFAGKDIERGGIFRQLTDEVMMMFE